MELRRFAKEGLLGRMKGFIWVDKINFEYAKFEVFIKHPSGNVIYAVCILIERTELEIHWLFQIMELEEVTQL